MFLRKLTFVCALVLTGSAFALSPAVAEETLQSDEPDHLMLAGQMVKDGHYDRAASQISKVDINNVPSSFDFTLYYTLMGMIYHKLENYERAEEAFENALNSDQVDKKIYIRLAQTQFALGKYKKTIEAIDRAGKAARELPGSFVLKAQCQWKLGNKPVAYGVLADGANLFPKDLEIARNRVLLLVDMGLYREATSEGQKFLDMKGATPEDHVAIAEALIRGRQHEKAILILETARLRYSGNEQVVIQLARAYMEGGHLSTAARLFREASRTNAKFTLDAAELFRRAGRLAQALRLNERIIDQKLKIRQRLGILIELERYEEAISLQPRLSRLGLLEEDTVVYALGYAYFKAGKFESADQELKKIKDPSLFQKSVQLRRAMGTCRQAGWLCQ